MSPFVRGRRVPLRAVTACLAVVLAGCGSSTAPPTPVTPTFGGGAHPVIVDSDLDVSDLLAIPILVRDPALDVQVVTVAGTGLVHCEPGVRIARGLLAELGREDIPVACGREDAGPDARPFPEGWRAGADRAYGLDLAEPAPEAPDAAPEEAAALIAEAVDAAATPPTVVALGPLTNLEDAFAAEPGLTSRVAGVHAMVGAVEALGNVAVDGLGPSDRIEWNAAADPSALAAVLDLGVPVTLVPLDATDDVPVPADLGRWLEEDHAAAGADLAHELLVRHPARITDPGGQLWDELAALLLTAPDLASWEDVRLSVEVDGEARGAMRRDDAGQRARIATAADRTAVESALLEALRRGDPRPRPFAIQGELLASWDGETCSLAVPSMTRPGVYRLTFEVTGSAPAGLGFVALGDDHEWDELPAALDAIDVSEGIEPPAWMEVMADVEASPGSNASTIVEVPAGTAGPVCAHGEWPDLQFSVGRPFRFGAE